MNDDERKAATAAMAAGGGCASPFAYTAGFAAGIAYAQKWRSMESAPIEQDVCWLGWDALAQDCVVMRHTDDGRCVQWDGTENDDCTHWMPLPLPPTEAK